MSGLQTLVFLLNAESQSPRHFSQFLDYLEEVKGTRAFQSFSTEELRQIVCEFKSREKGKQGL